MARAKILFVLIIFLTLAFTIVPTFAQPTILVPYTNNPGFENDSCPKDQDHLTCGWLINSQDCTFLSVCANIASAGSPEGSRMLTLNGTSGQAQQNNDILSNATASPALTTALEFYVRWSTIASCQVTKTTCLFKLLFAFNGDTKTANFYWANNVTVLASQFVNSSSNVFISIAPQCGALAVSASFCHYYNPNFMSQLQAYFGNSLTSYGFGAGTGTQHNIPIAYSIDLSFGCFIVSGAVCNANWGLYTDFVVVGSPFSITSGNFSSAINQASLLVGLVLILLIVWYMKSDKTNPDTNYLLDGALALAVFFVVLQAIGALLT